MDAERSRMAKASSAVAVVVALYGGIALIDNRRALADRVERWVLEHMNPYAGGPVRRRRF